MGCLPGSHLKFKTQNSQFGLKHFSHPGIFFQILWGLLTARQHVAVLFCSCCCPTDTRLTSADCRNVWHCAGKIDLHGDQPGANLRPWSDAGYSFGARQTLYHMFHDKPGWYGMYECMVLQQPFAGPLISVCMPVCRLTAACAQIIVLFAVHTSLVPGTFAVQHGAELACTHADMRACMLGPCSCMSGYAAAPSPRLVPLSDWFCTHHAGFAIHSSHTHGTYWVHLTNATFCLAAAGWGWGGRFKVRPRQSGLLGCVIV